MRRNKIFHLQYDRSLDNDEGRIYYTGIYEYNNLAHVKGNPEEIVEPQNYYAYIEEKGLAKEKKKKRGDPVDDVPQLAKVDKQATAKKNQSLDASRMRSK